MNQVGTGAQRAAHAITSGIGGAFDSASSHLRAFASGTETLGETISGIGQGIRQSIIGAIVDMGVRWVENLVIMGAQWVATKLGMAAADKGIAAAGVAANVPIALAQSALWAGPATLATIATFGTAAAVAPEEIALAMATTQGLALASEGGFFPGDPAAARGIFHGDEFIFSAPAVRNIGVENLTALHAAGRAAPVAAGSLAAAAGGGSSRGAPQNHYHFWDRAQLMAAMASDLRGIAHGVYDERQRKA
jgi:hypothetical protein